MKRIFLFGIALALIFIFPLTSFAKEQELVGSFTTIKGDVSVFRAEEESWEDAEIDMPVFPGDKVKTEERSEAELILDDGSMLRLEEKTQIEIVSANIEDGNEEEGKKTFSVKLGLGKLLNNFKKLMNNQSHYNVITSTAVAGVKGTEFSVECTEDKTEIVVFEGEVNVSNPEGSSVDLTQDQQTTVGKGRPPLTPQSIGQNARLYRENVVRKFQNRVEQNRMRLKDIKQRRDEKINQIHEKVKDLKERNNEKIKQKDQKPEHQKPVPVNKPKPAGKR